MDTKMVLPLLTGTMCSGPGKIQLNLYGTIRPMPMNSREDSSALAKLFSEFAEDEAEHAAELLDLLRRYEK